MTSAYASAVVDGDRARQSFATEADNLLTWDGRQTGHYEVYYLTCNHLESRTGYWIRYTLEAPLLGHGQPYAQLWFAFFDARDPSKGFALNQRFPIDRFRAERAPFALHIGDALLGHDRMRGAIAGDGHSARWDLGWLPATATHRHLPDLIYKTSFADTRVLSPNLDVPIRGTVIVDGRSFTFEGDPGGQTHLWGRKHAHSWAWAHCNAFEGQRGAALETLSVRLKRRGVVLPPLTLVSLYLDGEAHLLNGFEHTLVNRARFGTAHYHFVARGAEVRIRGEYACRPEDMVLTEYADPDGEASFCANTEVANLHLTVERRSRIWKRWHEQARLVAPQTAHFEVAGREPDPAIRRRHVTVA
jgi:hypothetical protein